MGAPARSGAGIASGVMCSKSQKINVLSESYWDESLELFPNFINPNPNTRRINSVQSK